MKDRNRSFKILEMPAQTYIEVEDKVMLIVQLKNKYLIEEDKEESGFERYET